ncbi:hypothetical protein BGZ99_002968, partial [Dissophora globulifera]
VYCDERYDGDCSVNAARVVDYFKDVVFKRTVRKLINAKAGYSGIVGVGVPQTSSKKQKQKKKRKGKRKDRDADSDSPGESNVDDEDGDDDEDYEGEGNSEDDEEDGEGEDVVYEEGGSLSSAPGKHVNVLYNDGEEEGESSSMHRKRAATVIASVDEKTRVIGKAFFDNLGRTTIYVPLTAGSVDNIEKALIYLWKRQHSRDASCPNPAPNPRQDALLKAACEEYESGLVYDITTPGDRRTASCAVRDPYTEGKLIRMLSFLWREVPLPRYRSKRGYNSVTRFQYMRERLCIAARHHMLLRDEDIRNLNLSDTFNIQTMHPAAGSKLAS